MKGKKQMNETGYFASYWQELLDNLYVFGELENQNEKLEVQNKELLAINKKLLCENERLKKKLIRLEEKIKTKWGGVNQIISSYRNKGDNALKSALLDKTIRDYPQFLSNDFVDLFRLFV